TDMNSGEHQWWRSIGPAPEEVRQHPDLQDLDLDFANMGYPNVRPSPLATRTLLFMAESGNLSGDPGGKMFRAYDKRSGSTVAEIELPAKASGAPMTYLHQARQYIVIAVATPEHPAELVALALPQSKKDKSAESKENLTTTSTAIPAKAPQAVTTSAEELQLGRTVFSRACASCHGTQGQGMAGGAPALQNTMDLDQLMQAITQG